MENRPQSAKRCPYCKKEFSAKRLNQVYCCTQHKSMYNNSIARNKRIDQKPFSDIISKNITIFNILIQRNPNIWKSKELSDLGVDLRCYHQLLIIDPHTIRIGPYKVTTSKENVCKIERYG